MQKPQGPVYYGSYLELDQLLGLQKPKSREVGNESHDETLFIIVHQVYELWFKQIIHEVDSALEIFKGNQVEERALSTIVSRLERVIKIQSVLVDQLEIMETMTPMDFLEFRDLLVPASGFQSFQFRELEIKMGLSTKNRHAIDREYFLGRLNTKDRARVEELEEQPSLFQLVESWLERMPFTNNDKFNFWDAYKESVQSIMETDEAIIEEHMSRLGEKEKEAQLENLNLTKQTFDSLLDEKSHQKLIDQGKRKLSQSATLNALFILLYRDEPILHLPYKFLTSLMDIDENFTAWRHRHAIMAHRMLGTKIGTGGSSGHQYLKQASENNRIFLDLFNLSTFIIPRSKRPELPAEIRQQLNFTFSAH
jgi:tryptophan 2,3-dioxygenase